MTPTGTSPNQPGDHMSKFSGTSVCADCGTPVTNDGCPACGGIRPIVTAADFNAANDNGINDPPVADDGTRVNLAAEASQSVARDDVLRHYAVALDHSADALVREAEGIAALYRALSGDARYEAMAGANDMTRAANRLYTAARIIRGEP